MKEEVLRIEQVTLVENESLVLDNFNLNIFVGEILGLICVNFHGQDALLRLIEQNIPIYYGFVYLHEHLVNAYEKSDFSYNKVMFIEKNSRLVEDLTVADNIFVLRYGFKKRIINKSILEAQVDQLSKILGVSINPRKTIKELSFYERCVVALVKAYVSGAKLVVLRDISNFMSANDLKTFHVLMRYFTKNGVSFLYICNHHQEVFEICDRTALMEDGKIKKYLGSNEMTDEMITNYCESFEKRIHKEATKLNLEKRISKKNRKNEVLIFRNVYSDFCKGVSFSIVESECAVLLDTDTLILRDIIELLNCNKKINAGKILVDGYPVSKKSSVAFINENPSQTMIMNGLSALDNLCFQLDKKQKNIWRNNRVRKSIAKEYFSIFGNDIYVFDVNTLSNHTRTDLVYYRILLYKPKLVVCVQPFAQADMYLRSHIISLINQLKKQNITVLVLAVSPSDSLYVADHLFVSNNGKIVGNYTKQEFHNIFPNYNINTNIKE